MGGPIMMGVRNPRVLVAALALSFNACSGSPAESKAAPAVVPTAANVPAAAPSNTATDRQAVVESPTQQPVAAQPATPTAPTSAATPAAPSGGACEFKPLAAFAGHVVKWEGACESGKASGQGALRAYPPADRRGEAPLIFLGTLESGEPKLGVLETPDGYIAGRFANGQALDTDDRNELLRAFREASSAAESVSKRLEAAGKASSAALYAKKAKALADQLD